MALTPNYGFIIPTGSDAVNLLTQCYPNFSSLDSILKPIQESGVTVATDTKVGTVHQLVRTDSSCNMFRFIATGNYASGDTFTVDGASVTATAMDGTAIPAGAFVINQSVVCILNNLVLTVLVSGKETTSLPASAVTYDNTGSGLTATNAQNAIDEVVSKMTATNIGYTNTVSGLTATDVQSAIDELALGGGGSEHGFYEVWANPNPTSAFSASTIQIASFDTTKYDEIEIEIALKANESAGIISRKIEVSLFANNTLSANLGDMMMVSNKIVNTLRNFQFSMSGTTLNIAVGSDVYQTFNTYGSAPTETSDNTTIVPVRILGLVHNS